MQDVGDVCLCQADILIFRPIVLLFLDVAQIVVTLQHKQLTPQLLIFQLSHEISALADDHPRFFQTALRGLPIEGSGLDHGLSENDLSLHNQIECGFLMREVEQLDELLIGLVVVCSLEAGVDDLLLEPDLELAVAALVVLVVSEFEGLDGVVIFLDEGHGFFDVLLLVLQEVLQPELFRQI